LFGGNQLLEKLILKFYLRGENFVQPAIFEIDKNAPIVKEELFVPILYVIRFDTLEEAIQINNSVP
jgi:aldehyde dehydrogenase family 7 protein A1